MHSDPKGNPIFDRLELGHESGVLFHFDAAVDSDHVLSAQGRHTSVGAVDESDRIGVASLVGAPEFLEIVAAVGVLVGGGSPEVARVGGHSISEASQGFKHGQRQSKYRDTHAERDERDVVEYSTKTTKRATIRFLSLSYPSIPS